MRVIGIAGRAGAGKNTVGGFLAAVLADQGYSVALDGFASVIKRQLREEFGWPGVKDEFWRRALQTRGAWARATVPDHWIQIIEQKWRTGTRYTSVYLVGPDFLILTDLRYLNEAQWCCARGVCWLVEGRGGLEGEAGGHASETELTAASGPRGWVRVCIKNIGDLAKLASSVSTCVAGDFHLQGLPAEEDRTS